MSEEEKDNETVVRCPVCNKVISDFDNGISDPCIHVMLIYIDAISDEFVHSGEGSEEIEKQMLEKYEEECVYLNEQMEEFADNNNNYIVLEMTTYGMCCGPSSGTEYILVKLK